MNKICKECGQEKEHYAHGLCQSCYMKEWQRENSEKAREVKRKYYQENKETIKEQQKKYYQKNKEAKRESHRNWHQKNKKAINERKKKYYQENKETLRECHRKHYQKNKEKIKAMHRKWRKKNPGYDKKWRKEHLDKIREKNYKRRAQGEIKKGIISKFINENVFKYGIITCEKCKEPCEENYHIDHIIPISKGGGNKYKNLQILCASCNLSKHTKIADYRKRLMDKQLFLKGGDNDT